MYFHSLSNFSFTDVGSTLIPTYKSLLTSFCWVQKTLSRKKCVINFKSSNLLIQVIFDLVSSDRTVPDLEIMPYEIICDIT